MLFRSRFDRRVVRTFSLSIGNDIISPNPIIRNLGFYMDCSASMTPHVDKICKSVLFHIRQIGQLRKYLDQASTEKLVHTVISSRLDYANSLLYGLPATSIYKLQRVQNLAARIVTKSPRNSHITPILKSLHWLPSSSCILHTIQNPVPHLSCINSTNNKHPSTCQTIRKSSPWSDRLTNFADRQSW